MAKTNSQRNGVKQSCLSSTAVARHPTSPESTPRRLTSWTGFRRPFSWTANENMSKTKCPLVKTSTFLPHVQDEVVTEDIYFFATNICNGIEISRDFLYMRSKYENCSRESSLVFEGKNAYKNRWPIRQYFDCYLYSMKGFIRDSKSIPGSGEYIKPHRSHCFGWI